MTDPSLQPPPADEPPPEPPFASSEGLMPDADLGGGKSGSEGPSFGESAGFKDPWAGK